MAQAAITYSVVAELGATAPGYNPNPVVEAADGNYYGTTAYGGTNNNGTIFRLSTGGTLTTLYSFSGGNDGSRPEGTLTLGNDGKLYGTTTLNGADSSGTFFSITTSGTFTTLHPFNGTAEGVAPSFVVKGSNGIFYGTSSVGGTDSTEGGTFVQITTGGAVTVLHNFHTDNDGGYPNANIVQGSDGAFYGSTQSGGLDGYGTIFRITTTGAFSVLTDLENFDDMPLLTTLGANGLIYGTNGGGIVTSIVFDMTNAGVRTTVHSFTNSTDGYNISSFILGSDGNYYGTATAGGTNGSGTFFQIQPSGTFTTLDNFIPSAPTDILSLTQGSDGNFYSTSIEFAGDAIIQLTKTRASTTLATFSSPGFNSLAALMQAGDGQFYGTTEYGGTTGDGTIFQVTTAGTVTTLTNFNFNTTGSRPQSAVLQDADNGLFYGTTTTGGFNYSAGITSGGTLFSGMLVTGAQGAVLKAIGVGPEDFPYISPEELLGGANDKIKPPTPDKPAPLEDDDDRYDKEREKDKEREEFPFRFSPLAALVVKDSVIQPQTVSSAQPPTSTTGRIIYSFSASGGDNSEGTFFQCIDGGTSGTSTTLYSFGDQTTDGVAPSTAPLMDGDGNIYGMTQYGGTATLGTVFKITPAVGATNSTFTTIHNFTGTNSSNPSASDGASGGSNYGFSNNLIFGSNGLIYGTTPIGGAYNQGTVFSMTTSGVVTILHSFGANSTDGTIPLAGLVQGADGNFYGTTSTGGANTYGAVFSITPQGVETIIHSFNYADGAAPTGGLIQANDGGFYGVTSSGGNGLGVVFRIGVNEGTQAQTINFPTISNPIPGTPTYTLNATASSGLPLNYILVGPATVDNGVLTFTGAGTVTITAGRPGNSTYAPAPESTQVFTVPPPPLITFGTWESNNGIASSPAKATPENDGVPNLLKYLCDINPNAPISAANRAALPTVSFDTTSTPDTVYLALTYLQYASETGMTINLQTSTDLKTWTTVTPDISQPVGYSGYDTIMELGVDITGVSKEFVRLNITMP